MLDRIHMPTALVACAAILALAGVDVACLVTHQPPEVLAGLTGAGSVFAVLGAAAMRALFGGGSK